MIVDVLRSHSIASRKATKAPFERKPQLAAGSIRQVWSRNFHKLPGFLGHPLGHWLMLLGLVVMWGSSFGLTKVAVTALPAETVVGARMAIAGVFMLILVVATGRRIKADRSAVGFVFCMALIGNCLPYWLISSGQESVDSGLAGILMATMPLATLVLAHFTVPGERMSRWKVIGFLFGFIGVVVLTGPQLVLELGGGKSNILAQLAIVAGALCYAINTIIARFCPIGDNVVAATGTVVVASFMFMPVTYHSVPQDVADLSFSTLIILALLGIISTGLAPVLYLKLIRSAGPTFLSLINYLIPLWALLVGTVFLGEVLPWSTVIALALILGGIGLSQVTRLQAASNDASSLLATKAVSHRVEEREPSKTAKA